MPADNNQQVTVRRLADHNEQPAILRSLKGAILKVDPAQGSTNLNLKTGDLVEVIASEMLYLGQVAALQGETIAVSVEHAVDRSALALIQQTWRGPAD